uniref:Uncharacterized protein n=1 Tax=Acrobeloides nanus TaxID=290746 RepID=A0A914E423_9BILA
MESIVQLGTLYYWMNVENRMLLLIANKILVTIVGVVQNFYVAMQMSQIQRTRARTLVVTMVFGVNLNKSLSQIH